MFGLNNIDGNILVLLNQNWSFSITVSQIKNRNYAEWDNQTKSLNSYITHNY